MKKRATSYLLSFCIWFGPTIAFLLVAEGAVRVFYRGQAVVVQTDPVLNHTWVPNATLYTPNYESRGVPPYTRRINGQGWLASYDFAQEKRPGVYRVAYVGDSFVEGTCPEEDAVPTIVGKHLNPRGFSAVEVINTGTSSYAPTLYYLLLKTKLLAFQPDLVVINVDMTDVFDDSIYRATLQRSASGELLGCAPGHPALATHRRTEKGLEKLSLLHGIILRLSGASRAVRFVLDVIADIKKRRVGPQDGAAPPLFAWCSESWSPSTQADVEWSMSMLREAIRVTKEQGAQVVVTAVPHRQQLEGFWSLRPMKELAVVCEGEGVPFLNPVEAFREQLAGRAPAEIYIPGDMHFNPSGYRMWAEIQLDFLRKIIAGKPAAV